MPAAWYSRISASRSSTVEFATGQVCHRQQPGLTPNALDQADGAVVATAPAGAVGHRDEGGLELAKRRDGGEETVGAVVVLGREELEREEGFVPGEQAADPHGAPMVTDAGV